MSAVDAALDRVELAAVGDLGYCTALRDSVARAIPLDSAEAYWTSTELVVDVRAGGARYCRRVPVGILVLA